jgi:type IV secretion system protein VirB5
MKKLRKTGAALVVSFVLGMGTYAPVAGAYGVPVVDGKHISASVLNHLENIAKWVTQASQMAEQIAEMTKHFDAITGSRGMGGIPDQLREQLKEVIANPPGWEELRKNYPTLEGFNAPKAAAVYDVIAKGDARLQALQEIAEKRMDQVNSLMQKIDTATDPAAKQDLANRLASEQAAIQAASSLMQVVAQKQERDVRYAQIEANREFTCQQLEKDC